MGLEAWRCSIVCTFGTGQSTANGAGAILEREPWPQALDFLEQWQALPLLDPQLQKDPRLMERMRWARRLGLPLMPALLLGAADPVAIAQRLGIPGKQQQWLQQCEIIRGWLTKTPPPLEATPSFWSIALEQQGWQPEAVALVVTLHRNNGNCCCAGGDAGERIQAPQTARDLIAAGWQPGPAIGEELRGSVESHRTSPVAAVALPI